MLYSFAKNPENFCTIYKQLHYVTRSAHRKKMRCTVFYLMILFSSIKTSSSLFTFKSSSLLVNPLLENTPYMKL